MVAKRSNRQPDTVTFDPDATLLKIFTDPETISDPYPLYAELREHAPIFKTELVGRWVFTRFDDARALLRDPRCGSGAGLTDERVSLDDTKRKVRSGTLSMLMLNPPDHTRVRGLVARSFTPRRVEKLRPEVEQMCDDLLDDLDGEGDFVGSVAFPLPANVISALVGVPAETVSTSARSSTTSPSASNRPPAPRIWPPPKSRGPSSPNTSRTSSLVDGPSRRTISSAA